EAHVGPHRAGRLGLPELLGDRGHERVLVAQPHLRRVLRERGGRLHQLEDPRPVRLGCHGGELRAVVVEQRAGDGGAGGPFPDGRDEPLALGHLVAEEQRLLLREVPCSGGCAACAARPPSCPRPPWPPAASSSRSSRARPRRSRTAPTSGTGWAACWTSSAATFSRSCWGGRTTASACPGTPPRPGSGSES